MSASTTSTLDLAAASGASSRTRTAIALTLAAITAYLTAVLLFIVPTNVDCSWLIVAGGRLLDGERLYVDILETNPPLSVWLYLPLVLLERATGIEAEFWLGLAVVLLALASILYSARLLGAAVPRYRHSRFAWLIPAVYCGVLLLYPDQFGQREQLALIALLPWIALTAARDRDQRFEAGSIADKIVAGLAAAFVVMVKPPYYALAIVLPSAYMAVKRRSFAPLFVAENMIGAAITVVYLVSIPVYHPAFIDLFHDLLAPIYLPLREPAYELAAKPAGLLFMAMLAAIIAGGVKQLDRDVKLLFVVAAGFVPAFVTMGKAWTYHAIPFLTLGLIALMLQILLVDHTGRLSALRRASIAMGSLFPVLLICATQFLAVVEGYERPLAGYERAAAAIRGAVDQPTITSISPIHQAAHPLTRMVDGTFVARHPSGWAIHNSELLLRREGDPDRKRIIAEMRDRFAAELAAELASKRPDIIAYAEGLSEPLPGFMLNNPLIAKQLAGYRILYREGSAIYFIRADIGRGS
jgi:hypothetical protein